MFVISTPWDVDAGVEAISIKCFFLQIERNVQICTEKSCFQTLTPMRVGWEGGSSSKRIFPMIVGNVQICTENNVCLVW